ncbi:MULTISPECIES: DNA-formamidopyrimidine glycosylase family protein [unclassified Aeromicrobium]|uniref:DNA-formamidopyrimidine glycosylase family protein n=1 Tax=unclassified Aeromicrobium TaxID=2633570 RepID=UPI0006F8E8C6|nr:MULTISPECIES: DNA-formamidopyrimidine glycosylase family protein [unclassified Aeromicrobium]KQO41825.1 DNA glycosylase [Aeromicrobium sp. Leaf245]KQP27158.1 DNA glycosylase [Aeromicrobium sp. Leaf272]KQP77178.1 DNA glycosylase [Aeromicrobium sp. Leaf289]
MPEGDTVWRTAHHLREVLEGRELVRSDVRVPQWATLDLSGRTVDEVLSRGKHLLIRVGDASIHSHLKMEGAWHVLRRGSRWRRPAHTARIVLETEQHQAIGFSLGLLEVLRREHDDDALAYLGPDLLGPDWDLAEATRRVSADPERPIFVALLDQRNLAGLGNEYVNELLFLSGLLPTRPVGEVPDVARVIDRGHRLLDVNKARVERTFTGSTRHGEDRWVYRREHARCRRCGTPLHHGELGDEPGRERITFWCPHCQT